MKTMKKILSTLLVLLIGVGISSTGFSRDLSHSQRDVVPGKIVSIDLGKDDITLMTDSDSVYQTFHVNSREIGKLRIGEMVRVVKDQETNNAEGIIR
jgi:hypothetical protein